MKFAILTSQFNEGITKGLKRGAVGFLTEQLGKDVIIDHFSSPGAFEIPLIAKKLAGSKKYDGVICLGCVIKGDTAHFELISFGATIGIQMATLETEIPITFGILTTYTEEQSLSRSRNDTANKGREAAQACLESIKTLSTIV